MLNFKNLTVQAATPEYLASVNFTSADLHLLKRHAAANLWKLFEQTEFNSECETDSIFDVLRHRNYQFDIWMKSLQKINC